MYHRQEEAHSQDDQHSLARVRPVFTNREPDAKEREAQTYSVQDFISLLPGLSDLLVGPAVGRREPPKIPELRDGQPSIAPGIAGDMPNRILHENPVDLELVGAREDGLLESRRRSVEDAPSVGINRRADAVRVVSHPKPFPGSGGDENKPVKDHIVSQGPRTDHEEQGDEGGRQRFEDLLKMAALGRQPHTKQTDENHEIETGQETKAYEDSESGRGTEGMTANEALEQHKRREQEEGSQRDYVHFVRLIDDEARFERDEPSGQGGGGTAKPFPRKAIREPDDPECQAEVIRIIQDKIERAGPRREVQEVADQRKERRNEGVI